MAGRTMTNEEIQEMLAGAPGRIAELTAGLAPEQLHNAPDGEGWSLNEVLAHLRSCADVWGDCIAAILEQDRPVLKAVNPRTWIQKTDYREQDFRRSLEAFTKQRAKLVRVLEELPEESWQRSAIVKGAGKTLERTVWFYAEWLATHERSHVKHIARVVRGMEAG